MRGHGRRFPGARKSRGRPAALCRRPARPPRAGGVKTLGRARLATLATLVAMIFGAALGGVAGYAGGAIDELLSRLSDFVMVLPATYVVLALRAVMPLVLPPQTVFVLLAGIFALVGWPVVARGV